MFLANCHLSLSWMPELDKLVEQLQVEPSHPEFRLWLSSSPHPDFPIAILQAAIKMTTEPPKVDLYTRIHTSTHTDAHLRTHGGTHTDVHIRTHRAHTQMYTLHFDRYTLIHTSTHTDVHLRTHRCTHCTWIPTLGSLHRYTHKQAHRTPNTILTHIRSNQCLMRTQTQI